MFTQEEIEKEVKDVFIDIPVRTTVRYSPNEDAMHILIEGSEIPGCGIPSISNMISGLDMLSAINPIDILRSKIYRMYVLMKHHLDEEKI